MSLKALHIVFILASSLMCFGVGAWLYQGYQAGGGGRLLVLAALSGAIGAGLLVYGKIVLKKLKHISYF